MIPISVTGTHFKSFSNIQKFDFPKKSGFYFLTGRNEVEPNLGANGVGKSTLFDLVVWIIYGKTTRKLKAGDIHSWGRKGGTGGEYTFESNGVPYTLYRNWKPNSLKLSEDYGEALPVSQEEVEDLIGLNYDSFLYSILFGQFNDAFFDLLPSKKSELMSDIMDLGVWAERSERAKSHRDELVGWENDTASNISGNHGRLEVLRNTDFAESIAQWDTDNQTLIQEKRNQVKIDTKTLSLFKKDGEKLIKKKKKHQKEFDELKAEKDEAVDIESDIRADVRDAEKEVTSIATEIRLLKRKVQELDETEDVCPTCGQKLDVDSDHIDKEIEKLEGQIETLERSKETAAERPKQFKEELKDVLASKTEIEDEFLEVSKVFNGIESELNSIKRDSVRIQKSLATGRISITDYERKTNPYLAKQEELKDQIKVIKGNIKKDKQALQKTQDSIYAVSYWVKGFKEVRMHLIAEVLTQLEIEVNNYLFQLGLQDWKIEFAMDKETKAGTIRKGFDVAIFSPYNDKAVPWEAWSGGESQRLKLAGILGLSNLILTRNGVESTLEVYDEPSQYLSEEGIEDLITTLSARARELDKQIWFIDHKNLSSNNFDGIVTVVKDEKHGSYLEVSEELEKEYE